MEDPSKIIDFQKCRVCQKDLTEKPWLSHWESDQHYKSTTCSNCGKKAWVKVNFIGSGDDNWKPKE